MSYELQVFLSDDRLPTRDEWQQALLAHGYDLVLDDFSPRTHVGYLPARFNDGDSGFEYYYESVNDEQLEELAGEIGGRNHVVSVALHSDQTEAQAAMVALTTLAEMSDGIFCDPQSGDFIAGSQAIEWMKQTEIAARENRMAQAVKKWGHLTERKCPKCNAPCPEYRKRCAVCEFEIGRA